MSRMNNQSRSLRIISKQNGWDPDQIQGGGSLTDIYYCREDPYTTDSQSIPGAMNDPTGTRTPATGEVRAIPEDTRSAPSRSKNADPTPGMPGA